MLQTIMKSYEFMKAIYLSISRPCMIKLVGVHSMLNLYPFTVCAENAFLHIWS